MGMDFEVTFRDDHIHVQLNAGAEVNDPDLPSDYWSMLRRLCDEYDCRRILVEGTAPQREMKAGEVVEAGVRAAAVPHLWLAYHLENHTPNQQSELYEAIAASKGVRVKFFSDHDSALNWLRQNG